MVDPDRRPTAQEIEELIDLVRREPASPAFIDLGEAYLALGRPRDALQVGNIGLGAAPDSLEGRVMLARAHAAMHQWKEAQGELLRVVKVDRTNRQGFALLGEVLLRRQDFERAVPVLQHAQNLDPTSPYILSMLKRARAGQPLDLPPPIPTPVPPRGETDNGQPILRSRGHAGAAMPPAGSPAVVARPRPGAGMPMSPPMAPVAPPVMPTMAVSPPDWRSEPVQDWRSQPAQDWRNEPAQDWRNEPAPDWRHEPATEAAPPPAFADASAGFGQPARSARPPGPPPTASIEGVRPRIVQAAKPQNAAAASLRQSAAVGENYHNDLLTGGLLDVAGVRVPDADFDLRPDRRWGRSTRRAFVFLFVVLVLGIGGGGTWYWWSEKQKADAVARLQGESQTAIPLGDHVGFQICRGKLTEALDKDSKNLLSYAYVAECTALEALLYGSDPELVDSALKIANEIKPDEPGAREVMIAHAAVALAKLGRDEPGKSQETIARDAKSTLSEQRKALDAYAARHDKDRWVAWLRGRAMLAAGERKAGRAVIKAAAEGDDGLPIAMIETADLLVDDGLYDQAAPLYDQASALYQKALAAYEKSNATNDKAEPKPKEHPLIVVGRALGRAEASVQIDSVLGDLNVQLIGKLPPRVAAYAALARSIANTVQQDYPQAKESLQKAASGKRSPSEPRFWARIAWAHYVRGDLAGTSGARARIVWFGPSKAEDDPAVQLVDAALLIAAGLPEKALGLADKLKGLRPAILRAYADFDLARPKDALQEADAAIKLAPDNAEAKILREQARMMTTDGKERNQATDALEKLMLSAKSKIGRHALGMAHLANGNLKDAQARLEQAIADLTEEAPNPLAYRSRTALAEILLENGDVVGADKQLNEALKLDPGYFPTRALLAKVVLRGGDPDKALEMLGPIFAEMGEVPAPLRLVKAEAIGTKRGATASDKASAIALIKDIKDKVPQADLSRAAAAIDPKLPKELGIPEPNASDAVKPPTPERRRRSR
jgi:tetratricopeptide (TPR) repeat protein